MSWIYARILTVVTIVLVLILAALFAAPVAPWL